jgi:hypothetical protein
MSAARNVAGAAVLTGAIVLTGLIAGRTPEPHARCARKVPGVECLRWTSSGPGESPTAIDPGDWNRFPVSEARGNCEHVACVVSSDERANP